MTRNCWSAPRRTGTGDRGRQRTLLTGLAALVLGLPAAAQDYAIEWYSVDGGGRISATGGDYEIGGTIGQPDAGTLSGGDYVVKGGFWPGASTCQKASAPEPDTLLLPGVPINQKVRYLSFQIATADIGATLAVRVNMVDLPPPFDTWNGTKMFVGPPEEFCENAGKVKPPCPAAQPVSEFYASTLQCTAELRDWSTVGVVHVYHEGIIPGGKYDVQVAHSDCDLTAENSWSDPLTVTMSPWGDLIKNCTTCPCGPPDGTAGIPTDVTAVLDKFKNLAPPSVPCYAPVKVRTDLDWETPNQRVDISDVTFCLDAFRGFVYPFAFGQPPCAGGTATADALAAGDDGRLSQLPVGEAIALTDTAFTVVPSETVIQPGDVVSVDIFVDGALDVRSYQVTLAVDGGREGMLSPSDIRIDTDRPDYIFSGLQNLNAIDHPGGRIGAVLFDGGVEVDGPAYLGTFTLQASEDAAGAFGVYVATENQGSSLLTSANEPIGFANPKATVTVGALHRLREGLQKE